MKVLPIKEVTNLTGLSRVTIWRLEQEGRFPSRVSLSPRRVGWRKNEIEEWLDTRPKVENLNKLTKKEDN